MTTDSAKTRRKSSSWIDLFIELNRTKPTTELFRKWAGIAAIAGALERRVWVTTADSLLFPNMFILLVSPPAVGKSKIISEVEYLWRGTRKLRVADHSVTKAALVDALVDASQRKILSSSEMYEYSSLLVPSSEFGVLVPSNDLEFMNVLNHLYDCPAQYTERRRTQPEPLYITNPQVTILSGTQPKYLAELFPEAAYGMGFMSRIVMVYSGSMAKVPLFGKSLMNDPRQRDLVSDFASILELHGEMKFDPDAATRISDWYMGDCQPKPEHDKLIHYHGRRILHALKLSMVSSVSRSGSMVITLEDVDWAIDTLLEAEVVMPQVFKEMGASPDSAVMNDLYYYMLQQYSKDKKFISEHRLVAFLSTRTPANRIKDIVETMVRSGRIQRIGGDTGPMVFKPVAKVDQETE